MISLIGAPTDTLKPFCEKLRKEKLKSIKKVKIRKAPPPIPHYLNTIARLQSDANNNNDKKNDNNAINDNNKKNNNNTINKNNNSNLESESPLKRKSTSKNILRKL